MPVTEITLLPGYSEDVRARLVNHVSKAVRSVIAAPPAGVTTAIFEAATYQQMAVCSPAVTRRIHQLPCLSSSF